MTLRLIPYPVMDGNADEAIRFYENALVATVVYRQSFGEMPTNPEFLLPEEAKQLCPHRAAELFPKSMNRYHKSCLHTAFER